MSMERVYYNKYLFLPHIEQAPQAPNISSRQIQEEQNVPQQIDLTEDEDDDDDDEEMEEDEEEEEIAEGFEGRKTFTS